MKVRSLVGLIGAGFAITIVLLGHFYMSLIIVYGVIAIFTEILGNHFY